MVNGYRVNCTVREVALRRFEQLPGWRISNKLDTNPNNRVGSPRGKGARWRRKQQICHKIEAFVYWHKKCFPATLQLPAGARGITMKKRCVGNNRLRNSCMALLVFFLLIPVQRAVAGPDPSRLLVVYKINGPDNNNNGVSDSLELAQYYALKRKVPQANLLGLNTSVGSYYGAGQYGTFYTEMVTPIQNALASLGTTNIDVILLAGELPTTVYDGSNTGFSVDSALMGINALGSSPSSIIPTGANPYFDPAPGFSNPPGHFSHSLYQYNGTTMYLVARLGSDSSLRGMDQVDQSVYADLYLYPLPGYFYGNAYVDSLSGIPYPLPNYGQPYTDAFLSAQPAVQAGLYDNSSDVDMNIAYAEHYVLVSGLPLKWENTTNSLSIGDPGATFSDGTSALTAPRALFYGGWYNFNKYNDVWEWLPGSFACDLNSAPSFAVQALHHGASAASYVVGESFLSRHQRPNILYYYMLAGYDFAEASSLATPYIGWVGVNEGDPLYAPLQSKTATYDTQFPALSPGYPTLSVNPSTGAAVMGLQVNDTVQPEVVNARVDYGPDTNYGNFSTSIGFSRTPQVSLPLILNQVYHYRITLTDPVGNITTTGDYVYSPRSQGLIGYWNFDEDSGSIAHDTSGSDFGYDATIIGPVWTTGKINSGLSFNGSTNYAVTPNIVLGNTFSISAWVSPAVTSQAPYVRIAETQYNAGLYLGTDASGSKYKFIVNSGAGSSGSCGAAFGCAQGGTVTSGWHLLTATFDGATATLYVDNAMVASDTFTAPANTNYPLYIARYYG